MAESFVQLPPNSSGAQIRTESGDGTNQIPAGVTEEVVIPSDAQGLFAGDGRAAAAAVREQTMQEVLHELRAIRLLLAEGFNIDMREGC